MRNTQSTEPETLYHNNLYFTFHSFTLKSFANFKFQHFLLLWQKKSQYFPIYFKILLQEKLHGCVLSPQHLVLLHSVHQPWNFCFSNYKHQHFLILWQKRAQYFPHRLQESFTKNSAAVHHQFHKLSRRPFQLTSHQSWNCFSNFIFSKKKKILIFVKNIPITCLIFVRKNFCSVLRWKYSTFYIVPNFNSFF